MTNDAGPVRSLRVPMAVWQFGADRARGLGLKATPTMLAALIRGLLPCPGCGAELDPEKMISV